MQRISAVESCLVNKGRLAISATSAVYETERIFQTEPRSPRIAINQTDKKKKKKTEAYIKNCRFKINWQALAQRYGATSASSDMEVGLESTEDEESLFRETQ